MNQITAYELKRIIDSDLDKYKTGSCFDKLNKKLNKKDKFAKKVILSKAKGMEAEAFFESLFSSENYYISISRDYSVNFYRPMLYINFFDRDLCKKKNITFSKDESGKIMVDSSHLFYPLNHQLQDCLVSYLYDEVSPLLNDLSDVSNKYDATMVITNNMKANNKTCFGFKYDILSQYLSAPVNTFAHIPHNMGVESILYLNRFAELICYVRNSDTMLKIEDDLILRDVMIPIETMPSNLKKVVLSYQERNMVSNCKKKTK